VSSGPYSVWPVMRECKRIGVDMNRMPILAHGGGLSHLDFVRWMRTIPGGSGHEVFVQRLFLPADQGGPHAPGPDEPEAPDVATHVDPELDGRIALHDELRRVIPPEARQGPFDFQVVGDPGRLASVLRALPDGAGTDAVVRALKSAKIDED
jgi:hypothetical protein